MSGSDRKMKSSNGERRRQEDDGFDFEHVTDEERFEQYCCLRDRRYLELVSSCEKEIDVLERGLREVERRIARYRKRGR